MAENPSKPPSSDDTRTPAPGSGDDAAKGAGPERKKAAAREGKAAPGAATETQKAANGGAVPRQPRPGRAALVVAVLALLLAVGAGAVGAYALWLQQGASARLQAQETSLERVEERLRGEIGSAVQRQRARVDDLAQRQRGLAASVEQLRVLAGRGHSEWVLAEVEYLLRIANHRLQLQRDAGTAIAALEAADERLRQLADPGLQAVRELIAREIAQLRAVPRPDLSGLAARLASLGEQVDTLAVRAARPPERTRPQAAAAPAPAEDWRVALERAGEALQRLVVIRRQDEPVRPLLGPEQEFAAREGLRLQLEAARLALLDQDPALYRASLSSAADWLQRYFVADDPAFRSLASSLEDLAGEIIRPELPDISASLRRLRSVMERRDAAGPAEPAPAAPVEPEAAGPQP